MGKKKKYYTNSDGFQSFLFQWKAKKGKNLTESQAQRGALMEWQSMTPKQKHEYVSLSQRHNVVKIEKSSCTGVPLSYCEQEAKEQLAMENQMKEATFEIVESSVLYNEFYTRPYYIIDVNLFLRSLVLPAEISIVKFNLRDGVIDTLHYHIYISEIPLGYWAEAQTISDDTHVLPLPPNAIKSIDNKEIFLKIKEFLKQNDNQRGFAEVYAHHSQREVIQTALAYLELGDEDGDPTQFKIYSMQTLFHKMVVHKCQEIGREPNSSVYNDHMIEIDKFDSHSGIACEFHQERDKEIHCSRSRVIRWSMLFSDYICNELNEIEKAKKSCDRNPWKKQ